MADHSRLVAERTATVRRLDIFRAPDRTNAKAAAGP